MPKKYTCPICTKKYGKPLGHLYTSKIGKEHSVLRFKKLSKESSPLIKDFENIIVPDQRLDIDYRITAHIEPKHALWELGKGPLKNIITLLKIIRNRELFNSYKKEAFLWVKLPDQPMHFPLALKTAEIKLNTEKNIIEIKVAREELGNYGIAPRFGFFELPLPNAF